MLPLSNVYLLRLVIISPSTRSPRSAQSRESLQISSPHRLQTRQTDGEPESNACERLASPRPWGCLPSWRCYLREPPRRSPREFRASSVGRPTSGSATPILSIAGVLPFRPVSPYRAFEGELSSLERDLFADAADGRWDEHSLLEAALIASGVDRPEMLRQYEARVVRLTTELSRSIRPGGTQREQAQVIFEFMHRRILRGGYQLDCTNLGLSLDEGRFNCVSASVLFNCLAGRFGLTAHGLEAPGHAMSRLILDGEQFDVETTCATWFRLGQRSRQASRRGGQDDSTTAARPGLDVAVPYGDPGPIDCHHLLQPGR